MNEDGFRRMFNNLVQDSITNYDETGSVASTPERRMLTAIVVRAMLDYVNPPKNNHKIFAEAYAFLFDEEVEFTSFRGICEIISNNPDKLVADIRRGVVAMTTKPKIYPHRVDK